jgi:FHS family Na+ dependent glucose MFS transporter 1
MFLQDQNRSKWIIPITIGYFLTFVSFGFAGSAIGPIINRLSESTGTSIADLSFLYLFRSFGFIGSSLLLARLFDRFPGNRLLGFGLVTMGIALALLGSTEQLWKLFAVMFFLGISANFVNMGCNTLMLWLYKEKAGPYLNLVHVFYSLGCITTPLLIGRSLQSGGTISRTLLILGVIIIPIAIYVFVLPSPLIPVPTKEKKDGNSSLNKDIWILTLIIGFFALLAVGTECTYNSWLATFLFVGGITDEANAAYFTSVFWIGCLVGRIAGVFASSKIKPFKLVGTSLLLTFLGSLGFIFFLHNHLLILISTFLVGFAVGPLFPNTLLLLKEKVTLSGKMNGVIFAFTEAGSMVIPWIIGQMLGGIGIGVFSTGILIQLSGAIIMLLILQKRFPGSLIKEEIAER